tara:strand:- start:50 stop:3733 length:3684 start_codon:yes stop_codon:yes gene_type:complete
MADKGFKKYDPKDYEGLNFLSEDYFSRGEAQQTEEIEGEEVKGFDTKNPYAGKNLSMDELFYDNEEVISSIRKYYFDRDKVANTKDVKDLVNEFRTDMRWMETNEVSAATTLYYLNSTNQESVNDFRNAYDAFKAMPKFYAKGSEDETTAERAFRFGEGIFDYVAATLVSPTGVLSLFTGGAGTAAKQAASRAFMTKAIERASRQRLFDTIKRKGMLVGASKAGFVDMVGGVATNTATQFTRQKIGAQEEFDYGQLALVSAASAIPGGLMGAYTGRKNVTTTREAMNILEEGYELIGGAALRDYSGKAGKILAQKETKNVAEKLAKEFDQFQDSIDNPATKPLPALDKEIVTQGEQILKSVADELGIDSKGGKFTLAPEVMERIAGAARTVLKESGQKLDPNKRVSQQVFEMLRDRKIPFEVYRDVIDEFGVTLDDFSKIVLMQASEYGRGLGSISAIKDEYLSSIRGIADSIRSSYIKSEYELSMEAMRKLSTKTGRVGPGSWQRLNNVRKGLLVSQPATAIRNGLSVGAFQAVPDIALTGFERIIAKLEGREMGGNAASDMFVLSKHLFNIGLGSKKENLYIAQILRDLPKQQDRLFGHLFGDIANDMNAEIGEGVFSKGGKMFEDGVKIINFLNRGQEQLYRSAAFLAHLERNLARSGKDGFATLDDLARKGAIRSDKEGIITDDMVTDAVDFALEFTFANNPPKTDAFGRFGNDVISWINKTPASIAVPFPRFMFAAMRYQYEFSPLGLLHSVGKGVTRKLKKGLPSPDAPKGKKFFDVSDDAARLGVDPKTLYQKEVRDIGKGLYGSLMLGMAYMLKGSEYGKDTKWYELKYDLNKPDEVIDTRALFPLPQYLFVADLIQRISQGRPQDTGEIVKNTITALTGTNFRPGNIGSDIVGATVDIFNTTIDVKDTAAMNKIYGRVLDLAGNLGTQYMQPFSVMNDVLMQYDIDEPFAKDFLGTGRTGRDKGALTKDRLTSKMASRILSKLPAGLGNVIYKDFYDEERKYTIDPTLPLNERVRRYNPLLKQFFGLTVGKSSLTQRTLEYYGLNYSNYKFVGGDAEVQRQLNHNLQKIINLHMPTMFIDHRSIFNQEVEKANTIASSTGKRPNYASVYGYLKEELESYRNKARELLELENPALRQLQKDLTGYSASEKRQYDRVYGSGAYEERLDSLARQADRAKTKDMEIDDPEENILGTQKTTRKGDEGFEPYNPELYKDFFPPN